MPIGTGHVVRQIHARLRETSTGTDFLKPGTGKVALRQLVWDDGRGQPAARTAAVLKSSTSAQASNGSGGKLPSDG